MQLDLFGNARYRVNLHTHTTCSDGAATPEEAIACYRHEGYDALALTDHWAFGESKTAENGLLLLSGIEYDTKTSTKEGLFHIVGIGMREDPCLPRDATVQEMIDGIKKAGGFAILAHPAWSLNTPAQILPLKNVDATEIYNSVSGVHMSKRPDSSLIVDMLGAQGRLYPLIGSDDTHYYDNDAFGAWIMVKADECTQDAIVQALYRGDFYATQGPEVHLHREGEEFVVNCSPCREIVFLSDRAFSRRVFTGESLTSAYYTPIENETFIRAIVTDENGKQAWTNPVRL